MSVWGEAKISLLRAYKIAFQDVQDILMVEVLQFQQRVVFNKQAEQCW